MTTTEPLHALALTISVRLFRHDTEPAAEKLGHRQRDLSLVGEHHIGACATKRGDTREIGSAGNDLDLGIQLAGETNCLLDARHVGTAQDHCRRSGHTRFNQGLPVGGIAVNSSDPRSGQPAHSLEIQLDHDGYKLILLEQTYQTLTHGAMPHDHCPVRASPP